MGVDSTRPRLPSVIERIHGSSPPRVVPVCTDTIIEIDEFITTSFTPVAAQSDEVFYADAFTTAFSLFSTNTEGSIGGREGRGVREGGREGGREGVGITLV